jgi:hypothetical protein
MTPGALGTVAHLRTTTGTIASGQSLTAIILRATGGTRSARLLDKPSRPVSGAACCLDLFSANRAARHGRMVTVAGPLHFPPAIVGRTASPACQISPAKGPRRRHRCADKHRVWLCESIQAVGADLAMTYRNAKPTLRPASGREARPPDRGAVRCTRAWTARLRVRACTPADIVQNPIDLAHVLGIDSPRSPVSVWMILTNEEMMIASHTLACIQT